jgi:hypothetical protein
MEGAAGGIFLQNFANDPLLRLDISTITAPGITPSCPFFDITKLFVAAANSLFYLNAANTLPKMSTTLSAMNTDRPRVQVLHERAGPSPPFLSGVYSLITLH